MRDERDVNDTLFTIQRCVLLNVKNMQLHFRYCGRQKIYQNGDCANIFIITQFDGNLQQTTKARHVIYGTELHQKHV